MHLLLKRIENKNVVVVKCKQNAPRIYIAIDRALDGRRSECRQGGMPTAMPDFWGNAEYWSEVSEQKGLRLKATVSAKLLTCPPPVGLYRTRTTKTTKTIGAARRLGLYAPQTN